MERDPIDILQRQARTRTPQLAQIRYGRMVRSPFAFFRGAAAIMASDVFLGWIRVDDDIDGSRRDYYVRQLWDAKGSVRFDKMSASDLADYAGVCGWTLARAHARSGAPTEIAEAIGRGDGFDREMRRFAKAYAVRNEEDHAALVAAVVAGRVPADEGL